MRGGGGRLASLAGATALVLAGLGACNGDTLYDAELENASPPSVAFQRPGVGAQVLAGRPIPIEVSASDSLGVAGIEVTYTGAVSGVIRYEFTPPRRSVVVDTVITPGTANTGQIRLQATARNGLGLTAETDAITVTVLKSDTILPAVAVEVDVPARVELTDSIRVLLTGEDNDGGAGLAAMGFTALVVTSAGPDTLLIERTFSFPTPVAGRALAYAAFTPPFVSGPDLPVVLSLSVHAWALDAEDNCGAGVSASLQRLACAEFRGQRIAAATAPERETRVVAGRSHALPAGSVIADAAADAPRSRLYLSNIGRSRVDVFNLGTGRFDAPVVVGSQPWGIAFNRTSDTLLVANSGGTSVSSIPLAGTLREDVPRRIHTPNAVLFMVERQEDSNGYERLQVRFFDFSDRPQFLAQDAFGRLLYSTVPTGAAPDGTIRVAENSAGWESPEVRILIGRGVFETDSSNLSLLNVDSMVVFSSTTSDDLIQIYDHRRGFPSQVITSGLLPLDSAISVLVNNPESDIVWAPGRYVLDLVGLSDTTFVAASGDRRRIAFGEGARSAGRVIVWNAPTGTISSEITIADLVGNASEHIVGLDLNADGTLGTARGTLGAYWFKDDLRLQGQFPAPTQSGSGSVLHPQHPSYVPYPLSGAGTLGFVADGNTIRIVDTVHFTERGEIELRDRVVGPLRASLPLASDNAGCGGADCIVAKLYGVTDAGTVVVVNVRGRDIQ